jgi:DNA polymerase-3 subunit gamma/tau
MDVVEMDAASETGIDDVREKVIENVQYAPTEARFKVYIIDEVHDLSSKAFDALLKTLEEPPAHVVFVLATTEYNKVPITIRSRCLCFQFRRGSIQDLAAAVSRVIAAENYTCDPDAVIAVARAAEGSWRDALSILEQVLAYSDGHITSTTVKNAIGTVGDTELQECAKQLVEGDMASALNLAAEFMEGGTDARQLVTAMQGFLRDLLLLRAGADRTASAEFGPERIQSLQPIAALYSTASLLDMMQELARAEREVRTSNQHRWILERTFARLQAMAKGGEQPVAATRPLVAAPATSTVAVTPAIVTTSAPVIPPVQTQPAGQNGNQQVAAPANEPDPGADRRFVTEIDLEVISRAWPRILSLFSKASARGGAFVNGTKVLGLSGKLLTIGFPGAFARDQMNDKGRALFEKKINEALQTEGYTVQCVLISDVPGQAAAVGGESASVGGTGGKAPQIDLDSSVATSTVPAAAPAAPVGSDDVIKEVLDIFGGAVTKKEPIN